MLLNILQCTRQPLPTHPTKNYLVPNVNRAKTEKACYRGKRVIDEIFTQMKVYLLTEIRAIKINIRWYWACITGRSELAWLEWSSLGIGLKEECKWITMWRVGDRRSISGGLPSMSEALGNACNIENMGGLEYWERRQEKNFSLDIRAMGNLLRGKEGMSSRDVCLKKITLADKWRMS